MNILFYTIIFVIGVVVGNYWAIKSEEIPKKLDLRKHEYTNNSNEEIISKLAYIVIGVISSVVIADTLNIKVDEVDVLNFIIYFFSMIYISAVVLISGIDRKYLKIEKGLLAFGIISSIIYMFYLCMLDFENLNLNAIYLAIYFVLLIIDSFILRKYAKDSYIVNISLLLVMILVFTDLRVLTYTFTMALIAITIYALLLKITKYKNKKLKIKEIPVGYFIGASNIIVLFMIRIFENYCM